MAAEIVLVRHATTAATRAGLLSGRDDTPLDAHGRRQAEALGQVLERSRFVEVLVSPVARAWQTLVLAGCADGAEVVPALAEWDYGDLVGRTSADVRAGLPGWELWRDGAPGGESPDAVVERLAPVVERLRRLDADALVLAHNHVLRALVTGWLRRPVEQAGDLVVDPASISALGHRHGRPCVVRLNGTAHLGAT